MVCFSYRKGQTRTKNIPNFPPNNYRRIFSLHTSRMSSPVFSQDQGSYLSFSATTAFLCSGHCLRMQLWQCPAPAGCHPTPGAHSQAAAGPWLSAAIAPESCTGRLLKCSGQPPQHLICLTAQTDNCASTAEQAKHNRGRNGQPAHRSKAPQLPTHESLNQLLTVLCLPWQTA